MSDRDRLVTIDDVEVKAVTPKALYVEVQDKKVWIPKSQLGPGTDVADIDDCGVIEIPVWLAEAKELDF